ncbi:DUF397 domain-containing protein [Longispora urticae]
MPDTTFTNWRTSTRSGGASNCVEVAFTNDGTTGVRDSKHREGPQLEFSRAEWTAFLHGVRKRQF